MTFLTKSRLVMTFLINLGVKEYYAFSDYSIRETGKELS